MSYSGVQFAALDGANPSDSSSGCQSSYIYLPSGWIIAPDNSVSRSAIGSYPWGTDKMVMADGYAYYTSRYGYGGYGSSYLSFSSGAYMPRSCNMRILIQKGRKNNSKL